MELIICKDYREVSFKASQILIAQLQKQPQSILGLATGSTPIGLYQLLIDAYKQKKISFKKVKTYNLDEYLGIDRNHPESYYSFMHKQLFNHVDIEAKNIHIPHNDFATAEEDIDNYTQALLKDTIDIQILGIGSNGHIGFNEPGSSFDSETFVVKLTQQTRLDNLRFFNSLDEVPKQAVTMGIKTIMRAKKIVLMATGQGKADAIRAMMRGPVSEDCPASILQKHPDVVVIIDELAASKL